MRRENRWGGIIAPLAILLALVFFAAPVFAGNTATFIGEIPAGEPPVAAFTGSPTSGAAPLTVAFTDQSMGEITSWAWDFDNNGVVDSNVQNPSWTYATPGTYAVKLTVTGPYGTDDEVKANYITVTAPVKPVAAFTATPTSGYAPLTVQFTDLSTNNPTSWKWEYQKSGTTTWVQFSTDQNPTYSFATVGRYSIRLTATNAGGSGTTTKIGYITVGHTGIVIAYFTASPTKGKAPLTVQFTDQSYGNIDKWEWDFQNDGTWDSTLQNPIFTYTKKGKYSVKLRVSNAESTCTLIRYSYITVT